MKSTWIRSSALPEPDALRLLGVALEHEYSLADLLKRPDVTFDTVTEIAAIARAILPARPDAAVSRETLHAELGRPLADAVIEQVQVSIKYAGYIDKQNRDVGRAIHYEALRLPDDLDYGQVTALSFEARQKLGKHRPETLGQASRISGITPAAVSLLLVHLKKGRFKGFVTQPDAVQDAPA